MQRKSRRRCWLCPSFGTAIVVSQAPIWFFAAAIVAITPPFMSSIAQEGERVARLMARGELQPDDITALVQYIQHGWWATLGAYLLFTIGGALVGLWLFVSMRRRMQVLRDRLERIGTETEEPIERVANDLLGEVETAAAALAARVAAVRARGDEEARLQGLGLKLQRALEYADTEREALDSAELALDYIVPDEYRVETLLADSSRAHLRCVIGPNEDRTAMCPVSSPNACAAVRRGTTMTFADSAEIDACPRLREHAEAPCSAVCTPLNVMGQTIGVLHVVGPQGRLPGESFVRMLELVGTQVGARVGLLRTLRSTQVAASTDPLTGLLNRRSFEKRATAVMAAKPGPHAVVMADLDHFKRLNDTAGHAAGDRALRLFARVLREGVREIDVVGRYGGEEFACVLVDCDAETARTRLEDIRATLRAEVARAGIPPITASFGVAQVPVHALDLEEALRVADAALYAAKEAGRDRIVAAGELRAVQGTPPAESPPVASRAAAAVD